jgi:ankyrin repeat protein
VEELAEVLAVDVDAAGGIPKLDENLRWEDQEQAVLSACSSLVAVVDNRHSRVVQFSHFSVKEFLTSDRLATSKIDASRYHHILLEPSHTIMAQACLGVLLCLDSHIDEDRLKDFPLARYAAESFGDHAEFENAFAHIRGGIDDLLDPDKPHFAAWMWVRQGHFEGHPQQPEAAPLYHVAGFGFRRMVDYLIWKRPGDLTIRGHCHYGIPLHAALYYGHANVALLLLDHCVDVDVRGDDDRTPLHLAVHQALLEVIRTLIERHANVNARDSNDQTPLHITDAGFWDTRFDDRYLDVVQYLLDHGADVDAQANIEDSTPLHIASWYGGIKVARLLLEHGAKINARNKEGCTPLHRSLIELDDDFPDSHFDVTRLLLEHGADVEALDNNHWTPLHVASQCHSFRATRLLLEHGANIHARNKEDQTTTQLLLTNIWSHSPHSDCIDVIRLFLERGVDVDSSVDSNHSTMLHLASFWRNLKLIQLLLDHGANINTQDNDDQTPLQKLWANIAHPGPQDDDIDIIRLFLERGVDVDSSVDSNHSTMLHMASFWRNLKLIQLLLDYGANINARDNDDQTPLQKLWTNFKYSEPRDGDIDIIRLFLEHGTHVDSSMDSNHSTMHHMASYWGSLELVQLLLDHGSNINVRNEKGQTPLHRTLIEMGDHLEDHFFDSIRFLLEHGTNVDALDNDQSTPLHVASKYGSLKAAKLLIEHGANIHLQNNKGQTPFQVALARGHERIVRLLSEHLENEERV